MKKKLTIFAYIWAFVFSFWNVQAFAFDASSIYEVLDIPHGYDKIELKGSLNYGIGPNAIEAGANDDEVYIQFNQSFGNVNIAIYNSSNLVVYSTVVDTSVQQVVIIPFTTAAADTYTVELSHADNYAEGDFEKN